MYTLGIPDRQKRRALGYLKQKWINFEESTSMEGFTDLRFPDMDEDAFRDITTKLAQQGVTLMGADNQLTERKMKKLIDLMNEVEGYTDQNIKNYPLGNDEDGPSQGFNSDALGDILYDLKKILEEWKTKKYDSATDRYIEYNLDIEELVKDYEMGRDNDNSAGDDEDDDEMDDETERAISVDAPEKFEEQVRKKIRKEIKRIFH